MRPAEAAFWRLVDRANIRVGEDLERDVQLLERLVVASCNLEEVYHRNTPRGVCQAVQAFGKPTRVTSRPLDPVHAAE